MQVIFECIIEKDCQAVWNKEVSFMTSKCEVRSFNPLPLEITYFTTAIVIPGKERVNYTKQEFFNYGGNKG